MQHIAYERKSGKVPADRPSDHKETPIPDNTCGIIIPRQPRIIRYQHDEYLAECLRPRHNTGPHVFRTPDGTYYAWEDDDACDCCEPDDPDHCTVHRQITEDEALAWIET